MLHSLLMFMILLYIYMFRLTFEPYSLIIQFSHIHCELILISCHTVCTSVLYLACKPLSILIASL